MAKPAWRLNALKTAKWSNVLLRLRALGAAATLGLSLGAVALSTSGCAVNETDVHRWETTERGPEKLFAVVTHDKYSWPLRTEAALSMIRIRARGGKRIGIELLIESLASLAPEARSKIVAGMTPELIKQMQATPPGKKPDGTLTPDPSIPFKDAAFGMLSHEPTLVTEDKSNADITAALQQWSQTDFENRIDYSSQQHGIEQMMRFLGAPSVRALPGLMTENSTKLDRIAGLIADLGEPDVKLKASQSLVAIAKGIDSPSWIAKQTPLVEDADKRAGQKVTKEQLAEQIKKYQDQELTRIFSAMKRVGGRPVIDYVLLYAGQKENNEDRRKAALAALEGRVDKNNTGDVERLFEIAKDDNTPDSVRGLAFDRLGELPKEVVVPRMFQLFEPQKKWKVRWVAASLVLKSTSTGKIPEFMQHLPRSGGTKIGMTEPISYGALIQKMENPGSEPKAKDAIVPYLQSRELGPKLVALGYFYGGKKSDIPLIAPHGDETMAVPKCEKDDECGWSCDVPKPGSQEKESKEVRSVGEFVRFCVVPSMDQP